eukprot:m.100544 g.100544  ORF g.100544 m.100544 type:complete len:610 (+) comp20679_c0_seq1:248-2077(+)
MRTWCRHIAGATALWIACAAFAEKDAGTLDDGTAALWAVQFRGASDANVAACAASEPGNAATVSPLSDTEGQCAPLHGAPIATPYYSLLLEQTTGALVEVKYLCADRSCSDCLAESTKVGGCSVMPSVNLSVSFRGGVSPNLLPLTSANTTTDGISLLWYVECGSANALREIDAVPMGNGSAKCTRVPSRLGANLYQSLYTALDDPSAVSGGWMCSSSTCIASSCIVEFNRNYVGTSLAAGQAGCFRLDYTAGLDMESGVQPPCACSLSHIYMNFYTADRDAEATCSIGGPFEQIVVSRLEIGSSIYEPPENPTATYYRYLAMKWNAITGTSIVSKVGINCESGTDRCTFEQRNADFLHCYPATEVGGSMVAMPPDDICYGSPNLNAPRGAVMLYRFSGNGCPTNLNDDPTAILTIRGYPRPSGRCLVDGNANGARGSFILSNMTNVTGTFYTGGFLCNANCSDCDVEVNQLAEGRCSTTALGSYQLFPSSQLVRCRDPNPDAPPNPPPGPPSPPGPASPARFNDTVVVIGASAAVGVLVIALLGFIFYVRARGRREYEALGGSVRSQKKRARAEISRQKKAAKRTAKRSADRGQSQTIVREAVFYDGI